MSQWVWRGIETGVTTTRYPAKPETAPGTSPGLPLGGRYSGYSSDALRALVARCPTEALAEDKQQIFVDSRRCVHCYRCSRQTDTPVSWSADYEWARGAHDRPLRSLPGAFRRSMHILVVDAGDCGACLHEVKQLNNPYYNMHRLGFFITPTPRHADILLVVGPVTENMCGALQKAYEAMPTPKRVVAVGACALSGGVFGPSFVSAGGVGRVLPVDVDVPGQPPPPLAILHGLLVAVGRREPATLVSTRRDTP